MKDLLWVVSAFIAGMLCGPSAMHRYMEKLAEGWKKLYDELTEKEEGGRMSDSSGDFLIGRDGALLCACGDARADHPNDGPCNLNGLGHGIPSTEPENKCWSYRPMKDWRSEDEREDVDL